MTPDSSAPMAVAVCVWLRPAHQRTMPWHRGTSRRASLRCNRVWRFVPTLRALRPTARCALSSCCATTMPTVWHRVSRRAPRTSTSRPTCVTLPTATMRPRCASSRTATRSRPRAAACALTLANPSAAAVWWMSPWPSTRSSALSPIGTAHARLRGCREWQSPPASASPWWVQGPQASRPPITPRSPVTPSPCSSARTSPAA